MKTTNQKKINYNMIYRLLDIPKQCAIKNEKDRMFGKLLTTYAHFYRNHDFPQWAEKRATRYSLGYRPIKSKQMPLLQVVAALGRRAHQAKRCKTVPSRGVPSSNAQGERNRHIKWLWQAYTAAKQLYLQTQRPHTKKERAHFIKRAGKTIKYTQAQTKMNVKKRRLVSITSEVPNKVITKVPSKETNKLPSRKTKKVTRKEISVVPTYVTREGSKEEITQATLRILEVEAKAAEAGAWTPPMGRRIDKANPPISPPYKEFLYAQHAYKQAQEKIIKAQTPTQSSLERGGPGEPFKYEAEALDSSYPLTADQPRPRQPEDMVWLIRRGPIREIPILAVGDEIPPVGTEPMLAVREEYGTPRIRTIPSELYVDGKHIRRSKQRKVLEYDIPKPKTQTKPHRDSNPSRTFHLPVRNKNSQLFDFTKRIQQKKNLYVATPEEIIKKFPFDRIKQIEHMYKDHKEILSREEKARPKAELHKGDEEGRGINKQKKDSVELKRYKKVLLVEKQLKEELVKEIEESASSKPRLEDQLWPRLFPNWMNLITLPFHVWNGIHRIRGNKVYELSPQQEYRKNENYERRIYNQVLPPVKNRIYHMDRITLIRQEQQRERNNLLRLWYLGKRPVRPKDSNGKYIKKSLLHMVVRGDQILYRKNPLHAVPSLTRNRNIIRYLKKTKEGSRLFSSSTTTLRKKKKKFLKHRYLNLAEFSRKRIEIASKLCRYQKRLVVLNKKWIKLIKEILRAKLRTRPAPATIEPRTATITSSSITPSPIANTKIKKRTSEERLNTFKNTRYLTKEQQLLLNWEPLGKVKVDEAAYANSMYNADEYILAPNKNWFVNNKELIYVLLTNNSWSTTHDRKQLQDELINKASAKIADGELLYQYYTRKKMKELRSIQHRLLKNASSSIRKRIRKIKKSKRRYKRKINALRRMFGAVKCKFHSNDGLLRRVRQLTKHNKGISQQVAGAATNCNLTLAEKISATNVLVELPRRHAPLRRRTKTKTQNVLTHRGETPYKTFRKMVDNDILGHMCKPLLYKTISKMVNSGIVTHRRKPLDKTIRKRVNNSILTHRGETPYKTIMQGVNSGYIEKLRTRPIIDIMLKTTRTNAWVIIKNKGRVIYSKSAGLIGAVKKWRRSPSAHHLLGNNARTKINKLRKAYRTVPYTVIIRINSMNIILSQFIRPILKALRIVHKQPRRHTSRTLKKDTSKINVTSYAGSGKPKVVVPLRWKQTPTTAVGHGLKETDHRITSNKHVGHVLTNKQKLAAQKDLAAERRLLIMERIEAEHAAWLEHTRALKQKAAAEQKLAAEKKLAADAQPVAYKQATAYNLNAAYKQSTTPYKQSNTPYKQPYTPYKQPNTPYKQPNTPYKQPNTPYKQPNTPYKQPTTPYKQPNTPYKQTYTPYKQPNTPYNQTTTPYKQPYTPYKQTYTPSTQSNTPYKQPYTPYQQPNTPYKQPYTPYQQPNTPYQQPNTPYQQTNTPYKQPNTPYKQPTTPHKQPITPYKQPNTPYRQPNTPYKQPTTSYNQSTPVSTQSTSPYKQTNTPYKQPNTPYKQPNTPYKQPNTPYKQPNTPYKQPTAPYRPAATNKQTTAGNLVTTEHKLVADKQLKIAEHGETEKNATSATGSHTKK
jgi:hypothetical protein